ncbi:MAG: aromatic aminobenezylarsenical efflux permease ArsG family transporter [Victivallales bacterium]|nr:aromatic aminobenezylarsenical efflux permease ArsG family transporter [Victivallales bacterium]
MNWLIVFSAFWLGILTTVSPCPLAGNIAAISFIGRQVGNDRSVVFSGLLYTSGRLLAYVALSTGIVSGLLAGGQVSRFLQYYLNEALGPLLIIVGMGLLDMVKMKFSVNLPGTIMQRRVEKNAILFSLPLGFFLALSFCPISAGLFFGALIPLAVKYSSSFLLPSVYGLGTALPVVFFAFMIAFSGEYLGKVFHCLTGIEIWIRRITGIVFILIGIYYCLIYIYEF